MQPGVYDCRHGTDLIRVIVVRELPEAKHNAMLHAFSGSPGQVRYAAEHHEQRSEKTSALLKLVLTNYAHEGIVMSYTMEDLERDVAKMVLQRMSFEKKKEFIREMSAAERKELIREMSAKERLEALEDLPADEVEELLKELRKRELLRKQKRKK